MKHIIKLTILGAAIIALCSCAPIITKQQCTSTNWQQMGFNDGTAGNPPKDLSADVQMCTQKYKLAVPIVELYQKGLKAGAVSYCTPTFNDGELAGQAGKELNTIMFRQDYCKRLGVPFKADSYKKGYRKGIVSYCTFDQGQNLGLAGKQPGNICTGSLSHSFIKGWKEGARQFCSSSINGFKMGRENKPYPSMCPAHFYPNFSEQYNRGKTVGQRVSELNNKIGTINNEIKSKADYYWIEQDDYGNYVLTSDHSWQARKALREIYYLVKQRDELKDELFKAKMAH